MSLSLGGHYTRIGKITRPHERRSIQPRVSKSELLERAVQHVRRNLDIKAQNAGLVHVLMENGTKCDKWIEVEGHANLSGFKRLNGNFANGFEDSEQ